MARIDYDKAAADYRRARTLPPAVLDAWNTTLTSLKLPGGRRVLDLGAGTGQFVGPLAAWLDGPVVAVEPSAAMRDELRIAAITSKTPVVAAVAESLPLVDRSVGVAWLSTVIHQFTDRDVAARELRRVVQPGGCVLVRGFFSDVEATGVFRLFPGIERSALTFPSTTTIVAELEDAGFVVRDVIDVVEPWQFPLDDWIARVRRVRSIDSALRPLTDTEIDEGIAAARQRWADHPGPVHSPTTVRLLVLDA